MTLEELHVKIVGNVRSFMGSMDDVEKRVTSTASKLKSFGTMASTYVTLPLLGIGAAAVKTASDVEEMNAKAETVFRNQIGMVREWAAETGDAVGRSENKLVGYAAALQDTFVPMGFARDRASELSTQMTQLAVDLASFNNTTDQQALG